MPIKKYSKVKFTLRKELVIILVVALVMLVTTIILQQPTKSEKFIKEWRGAGSQISENTLYKKTNFDDLDNIVNKADGYVYVFFANSKNKDAVTNFDLIMQYAGIAEVDKIYLIDSKFAEGDREEDSKLDEKLKAIEEKYDINLDNNPGFFVFKGSEDLKCDYDLRADFEDVIKEQGNWNNALFHCLIATARETK